MSSTKVESLLEQLASVAASPPQDKAVQQRLYDAAQRLSLAVESPLDTVYRVIYSPMLLSSVQTGHYLKLFGTLIEKGAPCSVAELAEPTGADTIFTARILRFLSSHKFIAEKSEGFFEANRLTVALNNNAYRAAVNHTYHMTGPAFMKAADFFKANNFQNPKSITETAFQIAHNTDRPAFEWQQDVRPEMTPEFGLWMTALRGQRTWLDVIDFEALLGPVDAETVIFVDVAGGIGSQCALLKQRLPNLPGRVILQELPTMLIHALPTEGVEKTEYNFWLEQPVKGARAYYLRTILHDYPDAKCLELLKNIVDAMGPHSVILIDDIVIPNSGAHSRTTEMDFIMMTTLAAMERTNKQWDDLLAAAGLELVKRVTYLDDTAESIQVVVPKGRKGLQV